MTTTTRTAKAPYRPTVRLINRAQGLVGVSSSDGTKEYICDTIHGTCTCPRGSFGRSCKHQPYASAFAKMVIGMSKATAPAPTAPRQSWKEYRQSVMTSNSFGNLADAFV